MQWQDIVISLAQVFFVIALIPSISSTEKPAAATSIMNVILACIVASTLLTLKLWFSAFTGFAIAIGHLILTIQEIKIQKIKQRD